MYRLLLLPLFLFGVMPAYAQGAAKAKAELKDAQGKSTGTATFEQTANGVLITVETRGLANGEHALHIHTAGKCEGPKFTSAGGHLNPDKRMHGFYQEKGPHAGDIPNIFVKDGSAKVSVLTTRFSLSSGESDSIFDQDGAALVIHSGPDDYKTDPAGDSGDRIACGVIEKAK